MSYEAIIFDLDGTAIPSIQNALPSQRLVDAVEAAKPYFRLSAATGRPLSNGKAILDCLGLVDPCVMSAGTQIIDPQSSEVIWECDLEPDAVQDVLTICKPYPYELLIRDELLGQGGPAAQRKIDYAVNVMYLMQCSNVDAEKIMNQLVAISSISASSVVSWAGNSTDIHITPKQATKEHAVAKLLAIMGVTKDQVVGVGDAENDIHLFKAVGLKVAMGNATPLLKSLADVVCDTVDNDGLAKFIENLLAKGQSSR